ncbi:hypothetical protein ZWY2020_014943 [Hordeum vulgare]|nr:hypothetical protein ZWY2020_014943 [Hordeum vulgare]
MAKAPPLTAQAHRLPLPLCSAIVCPTGFHCCSTTLPHRHSSSDRRHSSSSLRLRSSDLTSGHYSATAAPFFLFPALKLLQADLRPQLSSPRSSSSPPAVVCCFFGRQRLLLFLHGHRTRWMCETLDVGHDACSTQDVRHSGHRWSYMILNNGHKAHYTQDTEHAGQRTWWTSDVVLVLHKTLDMLDVGCRTRCSQDAGRRQVF